MCILSVRRLISADASRAVHTQLSNLCLVSRSFLPVARRFLYERPLRGFYRRNRPRAVAVANVLDRAVPLLEALQANRGYLGGLVKDLSDLASIYALLASAEDSIDARSFQQRGQTKAFSWELAMISACGQASTVAVGFDSVLQLPKLFRALASSDAKSLTFSPLNRMACELPLRVPSRAFRHWRSCRTSISTSSCWKSDPKGSPYLNSRSSCRSSQ